MRAALGAVGAEVYSLAYCGDEGPVGSGLPACAGNGPPAVFAFGFQGVGMTIEDRARVVTECRPEMATFNCGSFNFAIFRVKPRPEMAACLGRSRKNREWARSFGVLESGPLGRTEW